MVDELRGERLAAVVEHGFERVEPAEPRKALEAAGANVDVISPHSGSVKGWQHQQRGGDVAQGRRHPGVQPEDDEAFAEGRHGRDAERCGMAAAARS